MTFLKTVSAIAISGSILAASASAAFAGPMQSLSIQKNGIDAVPVEVIAVGGSFKKIKTQKHRFLLKIYAKAKVGKKVRVTEVTTSSAPYLEYDPNTWDVTYYPNKRTFSYTLDPKIKMKEINWGATDPIKACNQKLKQSRSALTKGATAQVSAYFQIHATNKFGSKGISDSKHDSKWMWYPVTVKCLPSSVGDKIGS